MDLAVITERAVCASVVCFSCCIAAITTLILAAIVVIIAMFKDITNHRQNHSYGGGHNFGGSFNFYPLLIYYNLDPIIVRNKPKVSIKGRNEINVCCCPMEIPHNYRIECKACGEILKSGFKRGSLILSVIIGTVLLSLFGCLTFFILRRN